MQDFRSASVPERVDSRVRLARRLTGRWSDAHCAGWLPSCVTSPGGDVIEPRGLSRPGKNASGSGQRRISGRHTYVRLSHWAGEALLSIRGIPRTPRFPNHLIPEHRLAQIVKGDCGEQRKKTTTYCGVAVAQARPRRRRLVGEHRNPSRPCRDGGSLRAGYARRRRSGFQWPERSGWNKLV